MVSFIELVEPLKELNNSQQTIMQFLRHSPTLQLTRLALDSTIRRGRATGSSELVDRKRPPNGPVI